MTEEKSMKSELFPAVPMVSNVSYDRACAGFCQVNVVSIFFSKLVKLHDAMRHVVRCKSIYLTW